MAVLKNDVIPCLIEGYSHEGLGVAHIDGMTVFVRGGVRGQVCDAHVLKVSKGIVWGKTTFSRSDCAVYPKCGGCDLRHLVYDEQLFFKAERVRNALSRIAGQDMPVEVTPAPAQTGYRNKAKLPKQGENIGYYRRNTNDIVPCENCLVNKPEINAIARGAKKLSGEQLFVRALDGGVHAFLDGERIAGEPIISERVGGMVFEVGRESFLQINTPVSEMIYARAIELAELDGSEICADLCCGIGTLTLLAAKYCKHITGVEINPAAAVSARKNAVSNGVGNVDFTVADAELDFDACAVFVDPPRKGLSERAIVSIKNVPKIVYISCNPETLARDIKTLGREIKAVSAFDMFPGTKHIETVVLL